MPTNALLLSHPPSGGMPWLSVQLANAHTFVTLQQPRTLGGKPGESRCEGTCLGAVCIRTGLLTSSVLIVIPASFWRCLQYSSSAVCWSLQPYPSLLRGMGCAGEEILWYLKLEITRLEMLLLRSKFLAFSEGEFPLNSCTTFFLDSYLF